MRLSIFLLFACFQLYSHTSDSLYISSYENYPLNKEVKIFFDEQSPVYESKLSGDEFILKPE